MARPKKNNAEYFSHDADMRNDVKIKALRRKFSHTGYAVWCFTLEVLTDSDYFEITWDEINKELLSADFDVFPEELSEIIDYCAKLGLLKVDHGKLYSPTHQKRFSSLLKKRERDNGYNKAEKDVIVGENPAKKQYKKIIKAEKDVIANENDIVKESRVKESKVENKEKVESVAPATTPPELSKEEKQKTAEKRRKEFYNQLTPFVEKYGKEMIRAFYDYWSELNKSGTQMRWELQKTWELERRLVKWANNDNLFNHEKTTEQQPFIHRIS